MSLGQAQTIGGESEQLYGSPRKEEEEMKKTQPRKKNLARSLLTLAIWAALEHYPEPQK